MTGIDDCNVWNQVCEARNLIETWDVSQWIKKSMQTDEAANTAVQQQAERKRMKEQLKLEVLASQN